MASITTDSSATPVQRADELLREMTVEEKAMQLSCVVPLALLGPDGLMRGQLDTLVGHGIGHIAGLGLIGHKTPEMLATTVNAIQRYLVTETRLGIPALFHNEALNGVVAPQFTAFPTPIGLAATWDPAAVEELADILRRQLRSVGLLHALAPVMDVARDARWGGVTETYGEDPYLVSAMSVAFTRGLQGEDLAEGVIACAKHFLGYAVTEAGQNMAATAVGPRELHDVYARPFEAAIRLAGLAGVMASYSEFEGVPIHTSRAVLTDLLRGRMGFTGTVVSDYGAVAWAQTRHLVAANPEEVASLALAAGMDVELPSVQRYGQVLVTAVESGKVPESQLDESVRRVLRDKFALGLFDNPYVAEDPVAISTVASDGDGLSRRLADESVTLLKNEDGLLPLSRDVKKMAVIGPHADSTMVGFPHYTYPAALSMLRIAGSIGRFPMPGLDPGDVPAEGFAAMNAELAEPSPDVEEYTKASYGAVSLAEAIRRLLPEAEVTAVSGTGVVPSQPTDIPAAAAAREADVVILYVGGKAGWYGDDLTEKEGGDTANIDLPPQQGGAGQRRDRGRQADRRRGGDGSTPGPRRRHRPPAGGPHRLLRRSTPGDRDRGCPLRGHQPRREAARHPAAACRAGADPPRPAHRQRLPADQRRHPSRLPRPAVHPAVPLRPRSQLHDLRLRPPATGERHRRRRRRTPSVPDRHQHRHPARDRGRAALRRRHGHRRDVTGRTRVISGEDRAFLSTATVGS
jgi:beta-xylosidase